eukprot:2618282-Pyramimonas_sp.AAC.1
MPRRPRADTPGPGDPRTHAHWPLKAGQRGRSCRGAELGKLATPAAAAEAAPVPGAAASPAPAAP